MEKNYNAEMDFILGELIKEYEGIYKGVNFFTEEAASSTKEKIEQKLKEKFNLKEWEINILFYTLLLDNYLKTIDPIIISIEGLVFKNNGGYIQKKIQELKEKNRLQKVEDDFKRYSFYLMIFTALVALGTIISAWFFAIEIWKFYRGIH